MRSLIYGLLGLSLTGVMLSPDYLSSLGFSVAHPNYLIPLGMIFIFVVLEGILQINLKRKYKKSLSLAKAAESSFKEIESNNKNISEELERSRASLAEIEADKARLKGELEITLDSLRRHALDNEDLKADLENMKKRAFALEKGVEESSLRLRQSEEDRQKVDTAYQDLKAKYAGLEDYVKKSGVEESDFRITELLSLLQQKGRLIDFLKADITGFPDGQVGAVARVVHQGCSSVLNEYFDLEPICRKDEGDFVKLEADYDASEYKLIGNIGENEQFNGRLVHHGWKAEGIHLPKPSESSVSERKMIITPAEVEIITNQ